MKTMFVTAASILALTSGALAADLPVITKAPPPAPVASAWDIAFGGLIASDYNFRGVSQSDRGPSVGAYFEPRFNITPNVQLYAGIGGYSVKLASDPAAEIDLYAGIRPTFGPLALDIGFLYYWYPRESQLFIDPTGTFLTTSPVGATGFWSLNDTDFWEIYGKATYTISDYVAVGGALYYAESWLNSGADGTFASANIKFTAPAGFLPSDVGAYVSAEVGHYWLGTATAFAPPFDVPDYLTWNAGIGFTYKVLTLDLRYYDTDLTPAECALVGGDPAAFYNGGTSRWCDATFIAKLSFDLTLASLR
ncbi:MAG: hypothetical protein C3F17_02990 [Bradyrhizobiaceae bacterium]|nr:MAG: hypothetical protein C3F17_02990 [Bradyrhizobiaceae bacterium]